MVVNKNFSSFSHIYFFRTLFLLFSSVLLLGTFLQFVKLYFYNVVNILYKLRMKSAAGPDGLPSILFKSLHNSLGKPQAYTYTRI